MQAGGNDSHMTLTVCPIEVHGMDCKETITAKTRSLLRSRLVSGLIAGIPSVSMVLTTPPTHPRTWSCFVSGEACPPHKQACRSLTTVPTTYTRLGVIHEGFMGTVVKLRQASDMQTRFGADLRRAALPTAPLFSRRIPAA